MLNHNHRRPIFDQGPEYAKQRSYIQRVKADCGLVEDKYGIGLGASHLAGQLQPLGLAAGQARRLLAQRQVAKPQALKHLEPLGHQLQIRAGRKGRIDIHSHQIRQGFSVVPDPLRLLRVPGATALGAGNLHIRQKLHVQADDARPVAHGTAKPSGIVGEIARPVSESLRVRRPGVNFAQLVVDIGIGRHRGADVDADGRRVDQLDAPDSFRFHRFYMLRQLLSRDMGLQGGNQALQDQRRLARSGYAGHRRKPSFGKLCLQRPHRMDRSGGKMNPPFRKHFRAGNPAPAAA